MLTSNFRRFNRLQRALHVWRTGNRSLLRVFFASVHWFFHATPGHPNSKQNSRHALYEWNAELKTISKLSRWGLDHNYNNTIVKLVRENFFSSTLIAFQPDCGVTEGGETPTTEKTAVIWRCFLIGWPPQPANAPRVHSQPKLANTLKGVSAWAINWAPLLPKDNTFSQAENGGPHPGDPGTKMLF